MLLQIRCFEKELSNSFKKDNFIFLSTACHPYVSRMSFVCHSYYSHVIRMSLVCHSYVIRMSLVCTRMSFVCHSYVLARHSYITRMSSVCHPYVLVCHSYVTRMYSYVIRMSLVCGFTMNRQELNGLKIGDLHINNSLTEKLLNINLDFKLKLNKHMEDICQKASRTLNALARLARDMVKH